MSDELWERIEHQPPYRSAHMFSLAPLQPVARLELLYVLQQRDTRGADLYPEVVRRAITVLRDLPCFALAGDAIPDLVLASKNALNRALLSTVQWEIRTAFDQFRGVDPAQKLVWDLRTVSQQIPSLKKGVSPLRNSSSLDFARVRQEWIREILMDWARTTNPLSKDLRQWHRACVIASSALALRRDGGADPSQLRFSDVTVVVDAFKLAHNDKGELYAASHQAHLLAHFFDLLEFGHREEVAGELSPTFVRHPGHHSIKRVDDNEDEIGKAVPEPVIRQLDQPLHLLGQGFPYGELRPEIASQMFRTIYVLLRDTGRRPAEIAGLDLDCLEYDHGDYQLIWHNMKGRRLRRRLPILQQTADAIKDWKESRARLDLPRNSAGHLFPAISNSYRHLDSGYISRSIRLWADSIPALDSEELGRDGTSLPFDRSKIFPYAFRHTLCQRYADAGVLQHVLQALMDHKSADTTAAYFQVSKKMKREAVDTLRVLTVDRHGNPAPMGSADAYEMRAVAVPWASSRRMSRQEATPARSASSAPGVLPTAPTRPISPLSKTRSAA
ncbi:site-specific integrase [Streptomyces phaeoluteigriseus]|uniref:Site-specific integrase n=2 Tax=Streptomyces phaeoluteigriseus TaxID=114686 RepID=A0ABY4Z9U2_9ACTN|nr:site-specific integrase [Streptomyces phaeoluteigriseus]USQ85807.1 site-specific integrase [Streptomyces phaeoluteigriseus]